MSLCSSSCAAIADIITVGSFEKSIGLLVNLFFGEGPGLGDLAFRPGREGRLGVGDIQKLDTLKRRKEEGRRGMKAAKRPL